MRKPKQYNQNEDDEDLINNIYIYFHPPKIIIDF